ncbi:putative periplasmic protease [Buchnera aphidicola (Nipponaphis monzeni)]|uniref:Putative periplasmic protease n=1 Tax=Buchnera aphidicola (Nipponaphis monzeni) TaxID=2495405 RepID=A0A455TA70_9GAMM|nr:protease SohB [Buchnera aphidicola]BBI01234.1 putative periplasmic protease [Buchnera aphidicola (Nipponaphis monzeni)]
MNFIINYLFFLAKVITISLFMFFVISIVLLSQIKKKKNEKNIKFIILNKQYKQIKNQFIKIKKSYCLIGSKKNNYKRNILKKIISFVWTKRKIQNTINPNLFVLHFKGDMQATNVSSLSKEITAIILIAKKNDQVLLCLESTGGIVTGYGLAAAQLQRLRKRNIYLIVSVDKVAASGGYMMACVANYIIASPFAVLGSIGVVSQIPNFNKLLKEKNIDIEQHTSGKYKRTLTIFGENTKEGREKFCEELNITHELFKKFVYEMRPQLNIEKVSNGEHWFGTIAINNKLIDELNTSDEFILSKIDSFNILQVVYVVQQSFLQNFFYKIQKIGNILFSKIKF